MELTECVTNVGKSQYDDDSENVKVVDKRRRKTILAVEGMELTNVGGEVTTEDNLEAKKFEMNATNAAGEIFIALEEAVHSAGKVRNTTRLSTILEVEEIDFTNTGGEIEVDFIADRRRTILGPQDMQRTDDSTFNENFDQERRPTFIYVGGKIEVSNTNKSRRKSILEMVDMKLTEVNNYYTNTEPQVKEEIIDSSYLTEDKRKTFVNDVSPVPDTSRKDKRRTIILDGGEEMELTIQSDRDTTSISTASAATKESNSTLKEQSIKEICSKVNLVGSPKSGHSSLNVSYENTAVLLQDASQILKMNDEECVCKILPVLSTNEENEIVVESSEVDRKDKSVLGILQSVETGGVDLNISNPSSEDLISDITCELLDVSYDDSKKSECCAVEVREEVKVQKTMNLITPRVKKLLDETKFLAKDFKFSSEKMVDEKKRLKLGVVDESLRVGKVKKDEKLKVVEESLVESMKRMMHENEGVGTSDDEYNDNCKWIPFLEAANEILESITKAENKLDEMMDAIPSVTDIQRMQQLDARILEREKELKAKQKKLEKEKEKVKVLSEKKEKLKRKTDVVLKEKEDCENNLKKYEKQAAELRKKAQRGWRHREGSFQYHNETGLGISYFEKSLLLDIKYGKLIRAPQGFSHLPSYKIGSITLKPQDNGQKETNLLKFCHWLILEGINQNEFLLKSPTTFELYKVLGEVSIVVGNVRLLVWDLEDIYNRHAIKVEDKTIWVTFSHMGAHVHFNLGFDLTPNSYPNAKLHPKIDITIGKPELEVSILEIVDEVEPSAQYMRKIIARVDSYLNSLIQ